MRQIDQITALRSPKPYHTLSLFGITRTDDTLLPFPQTMLICTEFSSGPMFANAK